MHAYAGGVARNSTPMHGACMRPRLGVALRPPPRLAEAEEEQAATAWDAWDVDEAPALEDLAVEGGGGGGTGDKDSDGARGVRAFSVYDRLPHGSTSVDLFKSMDALVAIASGAGSDGGRIRAILLSETLGKCFAKVWPQPLVTLGLALACQ